MKILIIAISVLSFVATSCTSSRVEVTGEVFIASDGGQNFKLGAVTVYLFTAEKAEELQDGVFDQPLNAAFQTATSSDGKFTFSRVPKGKYIVVASTSRKVPDIDLPDNREFYAWRLPVDNSSINNLSLNNTNIYVPQTGKLTIKHLNNLLDSRKP